MLSDLKYPNEANCGEIDSAYLALLFLELHEFWKLLIFMGRGIFSVLK